MVSSVYVAYVNENDIVLAVKCIWVHIIPLCMLIFVKGGEGQFCVFIVTKNERHYTLMLKSAQLILTSLY